MIKFNKIRNSAGAGVLGVATAMAAMGVAGVSTTAQAVNIAPDGLGEALIFPYYTVRNGWAGYLNITNTSPHTVFVKIRWNEGENSRDVRDFNIVLSPYDVWTAATLSNRNADGTAKHGARMITTDHSCTADKLYALDPSSPRAGMKSPGVSFTDAAYAGPSYDTGSKGLDRTSEGYITVFEMGMIKHNTTNPLYADDVDATVLPAGLVAYAQDLVDSASHGKKLNAAGTAYVDNSNIKNNEAIPECDFVREELMSSARLEEVKKVIAEPENVLKGRAVLIDSGNGVAAGFDPITLANFYSPSGPDGASGVGPVGSLLMNVAGSTEPSLNSAAPARAVYMDTNGVLQTPSYAKGINAVSALLSRTSIINDFNVSATSATDWVITFPTKAFYVDADVNGLGGDFFKLKTTAEIAGAPYAPFSGPLVGGEIFAKETTSKDDKVGKGSSCVNITPSIWDREEFDTPTTTTRQSYSPIREDDRDPGQNKLCYETNVLSFADRSVFYPEGKTPEDFKLYHALFDKDPQNLPGYAGWAKLQFNAPATGAASGTFNPLPVVGMRIEARKNPRFPNTFHGFSSDHAYQRGDLGTFAAP